MTRTLRIIQVSPTPERLNPYVHLLARSFERVGARCEVKSRFSLRWLLANRKELDVLHFHWGEHICSTTSLGRTLKDFFQLGIGLLYTKATRRRLIYSVHNLDPHERTPSVISLASHRLLLNLADGLHVHDDYARVMLQERVGGRRSVFLIPHGNYIGAYPNECSREQARAELGLDAESFAYLFLGQIRPHKGIEDLVAAFRQHARSQDRLVLAGWAPQNDYGRLIQQVADGDDRIRLFLNFVANQDIQVYLNASDICVLPYRNLTTSGAAILALSFARPIVAPRRGSFPYLLKRGGGILYDPEGDGLSRALLRARDLDLGALSAKALTVAQSLDWDNIARQHLLVYEQLIGSNS